MVRFTENCKVAMEDLGVHEWVARTTLTKYDDRVVINLDDGPTVHICRKDHEHMRMLVVASKDGRFTWVVDTAIPIPRLVGGDPLQVLEAIATRFGRAMTFGPITSKFILHETVPIEGDKLMPMLANESYYAGDAQPGHVYVGRAYARWLHEGGTELALCFKIDTTDLNAAMIEDGPKHWRQ
jgi:hypothetical protein